MTGLQIAAKGEELTALATRQECEKVAYSLAMTYYAALTSKTALGVIEGNLENLTKAHTLADAVLRNGLLRRTDADKLLIVKSNVESQRQNLRTVNEQQMLLLKFLVGMPLETALELAPVQPDSTQNSVVV